jgi:hypothetical protein
MAKHGFDAVWLMGVWERSPAGTFEVSDSGRADMVPRADFHIVVE